MNEEEYQKMIGSFPKKGAILLNLVFDSEYEANGIAERIQNDVPEATVFPIKKSGLYYLEVHIE